MPNLQDATAVYTGTTTVAKMYLGTQQVWPQEDGGDTGGGVRQQASGTWNGTSMVVTLPGTSAGTSIVALLVAGNTTVATPAGWTLRQSQVNEMGHYLFTSSGGGATTWTISTANGTGTWYVAEIGNGSYDAGAASNNINWANTYTTPSLTPTAGTRLLMASLASLNPDGNVRTISGWTTSFDEVADVCSPVSDYPMQGVATRTIEANGSASYSTSGTYSFSSGSRSAIIVSFVTTSGGGGSQPSNVPPTASFTTSVSGLTVTTNSSASTDSDGTIVSYAWDWGDSQTGTGANPSHTYASAGVYTITLTVTDNDGATHSTTRGVTATTGGFVPNLINNPSSGGYPDATNTGVPVGATLTNSGPITVTTNGAVIQNLNIVNGNITVNANNVTIRNCRITTYDYYPIENNGTNLLVEDCEITGTDPNVAAAISFSNYTARRLHVSGSADGFKANANCVIEDCYVHSLAVTQDSHNDGIQSTGGNTVTVRHNTIDTNTDGVAVQFGSTNTGWLITDNLIRASGWALNGNAGTSNCTVTNNRFAPVPGWYGAYSLGGSGNTYSGNYRDDTGAAI